MKNILMIYGAFALALAACGKGGMDGKLDEAAKLRDRMCECKDADCTNAVNEDYVAWRKRNKSPEDKPSDEQEARWKSIRDELLACKHKFDK